MRNYLTLITVTLATAAIATTAGASDIYKYTDEDGNVHYVDRPTGEPSEERVPIVSSRTDNAAVSARVQARLENSLSAEERRQQRNAERQAEADEAADREQRAAKCEEYRARLETYVTSRRLYREENGERVYLDDDERNEARQKMEQLVADTCDGS